MHADIRQLIAVRDREPVDALVARHVAGCRQCEARLRELQDMRTALRGLPDEAAPDSAWERIVAARADEMTPHARSLPRVAVAAAVVAIVAVGTLASLVDDFSSQSSVQETGVRHEEAATPDLADLQHRSRELEYLLQRYEPTAVMSLRMAGTIGELEDSIALIDYRLALPVTDPRQQRELWQRRVVLMETLLTVRAVERQAGSI